MKNIYVSVGTSTLQDGKEAVIDALNQSLNNISQPSLILFFSTVHYKEQFYEMLKILHEYSNLDVPIVGGTCTGFTCKDGSFTKGVVIVSIFLKKFRIYTAHTKNVRRNPKKAAQNCLKELKNSVGGELLSGTSLVFYSGPIVPKIPVFGTKKLISLDLDGLYEYIMKFLVLTTQTGVTRVTEFLNRYISDFKDLVVFGGCTSDDGRFLNVFEFYDGKIFKNSVSCIYIPHKFSIKNVTPVQPLRGPYSVEKSLWNFMLKKINGYPPKKFLKEEALKVDENILNSLNYRRAYFPLYFPFGEKDEFLGWRALPIGPIYGEYIISNDVYGNELYLMHINKSWLLQKIKSSLSSLDPSSFLLGIGCNTLFELLGKHVYNLNYYLNKNFDNYLILWMGGELIGFKNKVWSLNYTLNILEFNF